jgi:hypothetical protein
MLWFPTLAQELGAVRFQMADQIDRKCVTALASNYET